MKKIATNLTLDSFATNDDSQKNLKEKNEEIPSIISSICWNLGNPSIDRAKKQASWLNAQHFDLLLLTECKKSEGCFFIEKYFQNFGYHVIFPKPENNEYGVMIISKIKPELSNFSKFMTFLSDRVISFKIPLSEKEIEIIVTYVPSRNATDEKIARKKQFLENLLLCFEKDPHSHNRIFCGDFNVLEPDHDPHYPFFEKWEYDFYSKLSDYEMKDIYRHFDPTAKEYSWIGRTNDGYRYDHFFTSLNLIPNIIECKYSHEPRENRLSDHSAIICKMKIA
jgi:exodeoxyribonuclease-3